MQALIANSKFGLLWGLLLEMTKGDFEPMSNVSGKNGSIDASHLREIARSFEVALVGCCQGYVMKALGHLGDNRAGHVWAVRDSIIYRSWAINWHFELLCNQGNSLNRDLRKRVQEALSSPEPLVHARVKQFFVFDDLVFNIISLFDYMGNLLGFFYTKGVNRRLKWNGAFSASKDSSHPLGKAAVAGLIQCNHKEWVNKLQEVRSDLAHFKMNLGQATQRFSFKESQIEAGFHITLPPKLVTQLPFLIEGADLEVGLTEGAARLATRALQSGEEILSCLTKNDDWPRRFS